MSNSQVGLRESVALMRLFAGSEETNSQKLIVNTESCAATPTIAFPSRINPGVESPCMLKKPAKEINAMETNTTCTLRWRKPTMPTMIETNNAISAVVETIVKWFAGYCHKGSIPASSGLNNGRIRRAAYIANGNNTHKDGFRRERKEREDWRCKVT